MGNGLYALKTYDGHFITAENGGNSYAIANRVQAAEWETF
jgi:hypothetical protein